MRTSTSARHMTRCRISTEAGPARGENSPLRQMGFKRPSKIALDGHLTTAIPAKGVCTIQLHLICVAEKRYRKDVSLPRPCPESMVPPCSRLGNPFHGPFLS